MITSESQISVVIPVYGQFCRQSAQLVIQSAALQQDVRLEIILVESSSEAQCSLNSIAKCKHVFSRSASNLPFSPGAVRNMGIQAATGNYVYLTDADIVLQRPTYLRKLLNLHRSTGTALRWPPMRRLIESDVDEFALCAAADGLGTALGKLNRPYSFVAAMSGRIPELVVRTRRGSLGDYEDGLVFTAPKALHDEYVRTRSLRGKEPLIYSQVRHIGGVFASRASLCDVGGYCEIYKTWGNEDVDLQWKLRETCGISFIPDTHPFEVLHLDHQRDYFSDASWMNNKAVFRDRKRCGVDGAIAADRRRFEFGADKTDAR